MAIPEHTESETLGPAFDPDVALDTLGGDRELLIEVIDTYLQDAPNQLLDVRRSVEAGDAAGLSRAAHTLRGSVGVFAAATAVQAALALETAGRAGVLTDAETHLAVLEGAMNRLGEALVAFAGTARAT